MPPSFSATLVVTPRTPPYLCRPTVPPNNPPSSVDLHIQHPKSHHSPCQSTADSHSPMHAAPENTCCLETTRPPAPSTYHLPEMHQLPWSTVTVDSGVMCSFGQRASTAGGQRLVEMKAGQIALTVMFSFAKTRPKARVRPMMPYLLAVYWGH